MTSVPSDCARYQRLPDRLLALLPDRLKGQGLGKLLFYFCSQLFNYSLWLAADVVISRELGPAKRGIWFGFQTTLALLAGLLSFAVPIACYYSVGNLRTPVARVNSACLLLVVAVFLTCVSFTPAFVAWVHLPPPLAHSSLLALAGGLLLSLEIYVLCAYGMMMGLGAVKETVAVNIVSSAAFLLSVAIATRLRTPGVLAIFTCYLVYRVFIAACFIYTIQRQAGLRFTFEWNLLRRMLLFGATGQLGNLFTMGFLRVIFFYVVRYRGAAELGLFGVAFGLSERVSFLTNAFQFVYTRDIVADEQARARGTALRLSRWMLAGYGLLFVPLIPAAILLIPRVYGSPFRPAVPVFLILSIGAFVNSANQMLGVYINGKLGRPDINSAIAVVAFALACGAGWKVVHWWGMAGASAIISSTYLFQFACALAVVSWFVIQGRASECKAGGV